MILSLWIISLGLFIHSSKEIQFFLLFSSQFYYSFFYTLFYLIRNYDLSSSLFQLLMFVQQVGLWVEGYDNSGFVSLMVCLWEKVMETTNDNWIWCFSVNNRNREIMNRIVITIIFLIPSIYNYPGGFAMLKMNVCVIERIMK